MSGYHQSLIQHTDDVMMQVRSNVALSKFGKINIAKYQINVFVFRYTINVQTSRNLSKNKPVNLRCF